MNWMAKIAIVFICFSLCGAGSFIASTAQKENPSQKTDVMPVKNREAVGRVWILTQRGELRARSWDEFCSRQLSPSINALSVRRDRNS
jgi:hypothetical protein